MKNNFDNDNGKKSSYSEDYPNFGKEPYFYDPKPANRYVLDNKGELDIDMFLMQDSTLNSNPSTMTG